MLPEEKQPRPSPGGSSSESGGSLLQFKVILKGIRPLIWRRFVVPDGLTLAGLHEVLQEVMGWTNSHLHQFGRKGKHYGIPDPDMDGEKVIDEGRVRISELKLSVKEKLTYEYDFGDSWEHELTLEKVLGPSEGKSPACLKGVRACPPEDCGGVWGYEELLDILKDPSHEEYESTITWLPENFDPERFDLEAVNRILSRRNWKVAPPKKKKVSER